jgi:MFS family permease
LSKERTIAKPGFNRWLIPPCALATHPLHRAGVRAQRVQPAADQAARYVRSRSRATGASPSSGWIFTIAIFVLGASAALFGKWVQAVGPRKSGFVAAVLLGGRLRRRRARHQQPIQLLAGLSRLRASSAAAAWASATSRRVDVDRVVSRLGAACRPAWRSWGSAAVALIASPLSDFLMKHFASRRRLASSRPGGAGRRLPGCS